MANTKPSSTFLGISSGDTWTYATRVATTSGTTVDFTGLPSGARKIFVDLNGVGNTGDALLNLTIGDSGGLETSGYISTAFGTNGTGGVDAELLTSGFALIGKSGYFDTNTLLHGILELTLVNESTEGWAMSGLLGTSNNPFNVSAGTKTLSGELDRLRITLSTGAFDAGSIGVVSET